MSHSFLLSTCYLVICALGSLAFFKPDTSISILQKYQFEKPVMGTNFRIVMYHHDENEAKFAADSAFQKIDRLNNIFSNFQEDSEAMSISTTPIRVSDDFWHVLMISKKIFYCSNGAFDVTIGPASKLWRKAIRRGEKPTNKEINEANKKVGFQYILMNDESKEVSFQKDGMILDFGGIVKGYAVDEAYKTIIRNKIEYVLVDGGGDIFAGKHPENGWIINFEKTGCKLSVENLAVASSGPIFQNLTIGKTTFSHIINPQKAEGLKNSETINIMGPSCILADALATVMSLNLNSDILEKHFSEYISL